MDNLSFPLICSDWHADEEILLLEGIEMYGLGNWAEVAEHVGTKNRDQCINHYMTAYMNSPCYPFPDMSRVNGKNRKELLAMARVQGEGKKGISVLGDVTPKEESPFSPSRVKIEDTSGEAPTGRPPPALTVDFRGDRSIGVKKPKFSGDEEPSMRELNVYNPKRQEFDEEYDRDAEKSLAEMEFKENDSEIDRELKLRVLQIYLSRLDERKRRRDFILERNLLYPSPLEKELSFEDREVYHRFKVFMRFLTQEEHEALVKTVIEERKIRRRTHELQECRAAGCRTLAEAKMYTEQKRRKEVEMSTQKSKESGQIVASSKVLQKASRTMNRERCEHDGNPRSMVDNHKVKGGAGLDPNSKDSPSMSIGHTTRKSFDEWDITGLPGAELLSETEQQLCCQSRLLPSHYLKMQEVLVQEVFKGSIVKKSDAHHLFKVDPSKVDRVYEMVTKKLGQHEEAPVCPAVITVEYDSAEFINRLLLCSRR